MDQVPVAIITAIISGAFAMATALGSVWLKHSLEHPKSRIDDTEDGKIQPKPSLGIVRVVLVLALSFAAGLAIGFIGQRDEFRRTLGQILLYAFTIVSFFTLVLFHRRSRSGLWLYQLDSIVLWAAFMSGNFVGMQRLDIDYAGAALVFWLGFVTLGGIIILATRPRRRGAHSISASQLANVSNNRCVYP